VIWFWGCVCAVVLIVVAIDAYLSREYLEDEDQV
jgi:hypothetical protein